MPDRLCWRCDDQGCTDCSSWCYIDRRWVFIGCDHAECRAEAGERLAQVMEVDEPTPAASTERVRGAATREQNVPVTPEQFDRWLAAHDAQVRAEARLDRQAEVCPYCGGSGTYIAHLRYPQGGGGTNHAIRCHCPAGSRP